MDPDEALARFFQARAKAEEEARVAEREHESIHDVQVSLQEAVDAASDLFEWLANGGFAPRWSPGRTRSAGGGPVSEDRTWDTGEYLLWLNNSEGPHFGAHRIVAEQLVRGNGEEEIGERVLKAYPPKEFNTTIDPDKVDPVAVGTDLVSDHVELGYGVDNR
jgi:hypothetical protein